MKNQKNATRIEHNTKRRKNLNGHNTEKLKFGVYVSVFSIFVIHLVFPADIWT